MGRGAIVVERTHRRHGGIRREPSDSPAAHGGHLLRVRPRKCLVLLIVLLGACDLIGTVPAARWTSPGMICEPSVVGIIEEAPIPVGDAANEVKLADGTELEIDPNRARQYAGSGLNPGDLLLYGSTEQCGHFYAVAPPFEIAERPDCMALSGGPAIDDGDFVLFQSGLRLPEASDFDDQPTYLSAEGGGGFHCLNPLGQVSFAR